MKKKRWKNLFMGGWLKIFFIMKITIFFFLVGLLYASASVNSQQTKFQANENSTGIQTPNSQQQPQKKEISGKV